MYIVYEIVGVVYLIREGHFFVLIRIGRLGVYLEITVNLVLIKWKYYNFLFTAVIFTSGIAYVCMSTM